MNFTDMIRASCGLEPVARANTLDAIENRLALSKYDRVAKSRSPTHYEDALHVVGDDAPEDVLAALRRLEAQRLSSKSGVTDGLVIKSDDEAPQVFEAGPSLVLRACRMLDSQPTSSTSRIVRRSMGLVGERQPNYWRPQPVSIAEAVRR